MKIVSNNIDKPATAKDLLKRHRDNPKLIKVIRDKLVLYMPDRLDYATYQDLEQDAKDLYDHIDYIDYYYRKHYLCGFSKTLHRVFQYVRKVKKCTLYNENAVIEVLKETEDMLLQNELYELMARHNSAKKKILKML